MDQEQNKKKIILGAVIITALTLGLLLFLIFNHSSNANNRKVVITNLESCSQDINEDISENISFKLYSLVEQANQHNQKETKKTYTANIRDGFCRNKSNQYTGFSGDRYTSNNSNIIVDIKDAGQSWRLSYDWIKKGEKIDANLGDIEPECISRDMLVYGDFGCTSILSTINYGTAKFDPILEYMPYQGVGFDLSYNPDNKAVSAKIYVLPKDKDNQILIENDKAAVAEWFSLRGLDTKNYTINYEIVLKDSLL